MIRYSTLLALLISPIFLAGCITRDISSQFSVVHTFNELKSAGKIPDISPDEHGQSSSFKVTEKLRRARWLQQFGDDLDKYPMLYAVDVKADNKHLMFFFSQERHLTRLVAAYREENSVWHELRLADESRPNTALEPTPTAP
jgi:hypothetical protein